jgi:hypothetical protein
MNVSAERHLAKAQNYLAKGDEYYRKVKPELEAAIAAGASQVEAARYLARSRKWVQDVLAWDGQGSLYSEDTPARQRRQAVQVLREAPMEAVERIIDELPRERRQAVAAAAGHAYSKARREYEEAERNLTPLQHKEREVASAELSAGIDRALGGFAAMGIVDHIEQATEDLREQVEKQALSADLLRAIDTAIDALLEEREVARAMFGLEVE